MIIGAKICKSIDSRLGKWFRGASRRVRSFGTHNPEASSARIVPPRIEFMMRDAAALETKKLPRFYPGSYFVR